MLVFFNTLKGNIFYKFVRLAQDRDPDPQKINADPHFHSPDYNQLVTMRALILVNSKHRVINVIIIISSSVSDQYQT